MKTDLNNAVSEAVNALHQLSEELANFIEGRADRLTDKRIAGARAAGITVQATRIAERLFYAADQSSR